MIVRFVDAETTEDVGTIENEIVFVPSVGDFVVVRKMLRGDPICVGSGKVRERIIEYNVDTNEEEIRVGLN